MLATSTSRLSALVVIACLAVSACSILQGDKVDYKSATGGVPLEVPPDLTQLNRENRYQLPTNGGVSGKVADAVPATTAAIGIGDMRIERSGNQRWLVVKRPPEVLWTQLTDFWKSNGFALTTEDSAIGIMETEWAENRAKIPDDFVRNTLGKIFDQLYSTGERDRFRTRLERLPSGETEIYVSHRGLTEKISSLLPGQESSVVWAAKDRDAELEAEYLRRIMVRLGATADQSKAIVEAAPTARPELAVQVKGEQASLTIPEKFDTAWRRVGLTLDRTGFTVVNRDREQGVYFVRYAPPAATNKNPGLLTKLFSGTSKEEPVRQYRVKVTGADSTSTISVQSENGAAASLTDAQNILKLLAQDLR